MHSRAVTRLVRASRAGRTPCRDCCARDGSSSFWALFEQEEPEGSKTRGELMARRASVEGVECGNNEATGRERRGSSPRWFVSALAQLGGDHAVRVVHPASKGLVLQLVMLPGGRVLPQMVNLVGERSLPDLGVPDQADPVRVVVENLAHDGRASPGRPSAFPGSSSTHSMVPPQGMPGQRSWRTPSALSAPEGGVPTWVQPRGVRRWASHGSNASRPRAITGKAMGRMIPRVSKTLS